MRVALFKVYVSDQDEAKRFYRDQLGFDLSEDEMLGDYRWITVKARGNTDVCINLELAKTTEERELVGRQAAGQPLFGLSTDNCHRDFAELRNRGVRFEGEPQVMPYGIGVMLQDLYGNKIYLNQDPA